MTKYLFFILLNGFLSVVSYGQMAYVATDTSIAYGADLVENNAIISSRICQEIYNDSIISYSPDQVREYQYSDGRLYISKQIETPDSLKRVFLEQLVKGNTTLYFYKSDGIKTFFIEKDSTVFKELVKRSKVKKGYKKVLRGVCKDCSHMDVAIANVSYRKKSLSKLVTRYNNCEKKPFPHFRYGVTLGYEYAKFTASSNINNKDIAYFDFDHDKTIAFGLFVDQPIMSSDVSFHGEFYYVKHAYSYNKFKVDKDIDLVVNLSSLRLPLLIRYAYPSNYVRPFLNAGFIASYNFNNETLFYEMLRSDDTYALVEYRDSSSLIADLNIGYCVGGGLDILLGAKHSLFLELRYTNQSFFSLNDPLKMSGYNLIASFNF